MADKELVLRQLGIRLEPQQVDQAYQILESNPEYKEFFAAIKSAPPTKSNENLFIETIKSSHTKIAEIPENIEVIQCRQNTFTIRAINPENIKSLTDRAFFNSFNLQRNALNDINSKNSENYESVKEQRKRALNEEQPRGGRDGDEDEKCICEKVIPNSEWVQCINEEKCRGSNWYHLECAGFEIKDLEKVKQKQFVCESCKRENKDQESDGSSKKKRKNDKEDE